MKTRFVVNEYQGRVFLHLGLRDVLRLLLGKRVMREDCGAWQVYMRVVP